MNNIDLKNVLRLCKFNLLTTRKTIIGWSVAILGVMTLYMALFSSIQEMATAKFDVMPEELLQFVGMEDMSDMSNYTSYYGTIFGLILVAVSIFSATFSAGLIIKEEKSKSIEFLNSLAVSRTEIYISKYITATLAVGIVLSCAIISAIVCGYFGGGETFDLMAIISSGKISSFTALIFGAIGFKIAGINANLGTGAVASGVVMVSYMAGYLGQLLGENGELLLYLSPFIMFSVENTIELNEKTAITLAVYIVVYIFSLVAGCVGYNKRDLKI